MAVEIELKLRLDPSDIQRLVGAINQVANSQPTRQLNNIYFDTDRAELAAQRCALRIRQHGNQFEQTLKTVGHSEAGLQQRHEWNWPLSHNHLDITLLQDPYVQRHWPASIAIDQLKPYFATHFERQVWHWQDGENAIEIVLDQGHIAHQHEQQRLCELELELLNGDVEPLWHLAQQLAQHCPLWLSDISKAERGYQLADRKSPWSNRLTSSAIAHASSNLCLQALQRHIEYTFWYEQAMDLDAVNALITRLHSHVTTESAHTALQVLAQTMQAHNNDSLHRLRQQTLIGQALLTLSHAVYTETRQQRTESTSPSSDV